MIIAIGSDHGGFDYKKEIIEKLEKEGHEVIDCGTFSKDSCNYAEFALKVANEVALKNAEKGIVICNSGEGVSIAANKVKGVRCGIGYCDEVAQLLRNHNDANMIAFGAHFATLEEVERRIDIFLKSEFLGERHQKRVQTIIDYENK